MALSLKDSVVMNITGTASNNVPKRSVLYNNGTGSNGTITLSASAANYNHMRIFYREADDSPNPYASQDVFSPNGKDVPLGMVLAWGSKNVWMYSRVIGISGTGISTRSGTAYGYAGIRNDGSTTNTYANHIYIVRVEAWNE